MLVSALGVGRVLGAWPSAPHMPTEQCMCEQQPAPGMLCPVWPWPGLAEPLGHSVHQGWMASRAPAPSTGQASSGGFWIHHKQESPGDAQVRHSLLGPWDRTPVPVADPAPLPPEARASFFTAQGPSTLVPVSFFILSPQRAGDHASPTEACSPPQAQHTVGIDYFNPRKHFVHKVGKE